MQDKLVVSLPTVCALPAACPSSALLHAAGAAWFLALGGFAASWSLAYGTPCVDRETVMACPW